ncbi:unnamed protein product [Nesidiocoris tenuis]|uniref:Uncharacterized protein n=1 Tax=Nesidiocoris tenuis TaxID=355587 RepID=A0A6H5G046_9HEMI|nr:unnamed protein product [Nesidiocoris tenuis]
MTCQDIVLNSSDPLLEGGRERPGQLRLSGEKPTPGTGSQHCRLQAAMIQASRCQKIVLKNTTWCVLLHHLNPADLHFQAQYFACLQSPMFSLDETVCLWMVALCVADFCFGDEGKLVEDTGCEWTSMDCNPTGDHQLDSSRATLLHGRNVHHIE